MSQAEKQGISANDQAGQPTIKAREIANHQSAMVVGIRRCIILKEEIT
jgi:hypothetical protein